MDWLSSGCPLELGRTTHKKKRARCGPRTGVFYTLQSVETFLTHPMDHGVARRRFSQPIGADHGLVAAVTLLELHDRRRRLRDLEKHEERV